MSVKTIDRLGLALVVLTALLVGYLVLAHGFGKERLLRQEKSRLAAAAVEMKLAETRIDRLGSSLKTITDDLKSMSRQVPDSAEMGEFLQRLDESLKRRGLLLVSVQPQGVVKEGLYEKIPVRLSCRGSFAGLYRFIQDLEAADRITVIERLSIGKTDLSGTCLLDLTALLFTKGSRTGPTRGAS